MKAIKLILFVAAIWFTFATFRSIGSETLLTNFLIAIVCWLALPFLSDGDYREN